MDTPSVKGVKASTNMERKAGDKMDMSMNAELQYQNRKISVSNSMKETGKNKYHSEAEVCLPCLFWGCGQQ